MPALHAGLCSHQGGRKNDTVNYYCQVAILALGAGGGLLRELFLFVLSPADTACTGETARLFRLWKSRVWFHLRENFSTGKTLVIFPGA